MFNIFQFITPNQSMGVTEWDSEGSTVFCWSPYRHNNGDNKSPRGEKKVNIHIVY